MAAWIAKIGQLLSNPEALEKICGVLPEISDDLKEIAVSYPALVIESEKLEQKNRDAYNEMCKIVLTSLERTLESENSSEEERRFLIEKMFELLNMHSDKTTDNRETTMRNIRMVGEFLLLGPFGVVPEAIIRKSKKTKEIEDKQ